MSTATDELARKMGSLLKDAAPDLKLMSKQWHETFDQIFKGFSPDKWTLEPTDAPMPQGWRSFKDSAKVKFLCKSCGNSWTSMRGVVIFWFNKISEKPEGKEEKDQGNSRDSEAGASRCENGNVYSLRFRLYGQKCKRCDNEEFKSPEWYGEEVEKVLNNVHKKIGEDFYDFPQPDIDNNRRHGRPRWSHDSSRCQACQEGQCSNNRSR